MPPKREQLAGNGSVLPAITCPSCGTGLDAATSVDRIETGQEFRPVPGDITVCIKCTDVLVFDAQMMPKPATVAQLMALDQVAINQIERVQNAIKKTR